MVAILDMGDDLGFADDKAVKAGRYVQEMFDGGGVVQDVQRIAKFDQGNVAELSDELG